MVYYIIPARAGSKGFPGKNRKLIPLIEERLKKKVQYRTIVTTDDEEIRDWASETPMKVVDRPDDLATDEASIKPVLKHAIEQQRLYNSDDVVLLYPTYPGRSYEDITDVLHWYQQNKARTCLCCQPPTEDTPTHLAVDVDENTHRANFPFETEPIPYRRQDAESTLSDVNTSKANRLRELSHFMCVFRVSELDQLSNNLFNQNTIYYELSDRVIDVDHESDWNKYLDRQEGQAEE